MRPVLGSVRMNGVVVIGEGEKDEAPMLYNGERVGDGSGPEWDIAVDPVDGTTLTAKSLPDAVSVLGVSPRGTMFSPGPAVYMQKLVVPGYVADQVDLDAPLADTLAGSPRATDRAVSELTVAVLDRPRHSTSSPRSARPGPGSGSCSTATWPARSWPSPPAPGWTCWSASAAPRRVCSAACALRCLGGELIGRLVARDDDERRAILDAGFDLDRVLTTADLVAGDNVFFAATGVTDGALLKGVRFESHRIVTHSLSMRSRSGTVRLIEGRHDPERSFLVNH